MRLRPLGDRVLVVPDAKRTQTESGIVLPEMRWSDDPDTSGVVAVLGSGCRGAVSVGDHVTFAGHVGQAFVLAGTPYLVMRESEIAAVLETA